jgi:biopolymer transport protein TolR
MAFGNRQDDDGLLADINVTPLVDVMLVLLIIFMITAPMLQQGIDVALPEADAPNLPTPDEQPLVLSVRKDGLLYLRNQPLDPADAATHLVPLLENRSDRFVYLQGDREVPYGKVVEVIDLLYRGGIRDVGLVTTEPETRRRR